MTAYTFLLTLPDPVEPPDLSSVTACGAFYLQGSDAQLSNPDFESGDTLRFGFTNRSIENCSFAALKMYPVIGKTPARNPFAGYQGLDFSMIDLINAGWSLTFSEKTPNGTWTFSMYVTVSGYQYHLPDPEMRVGTGEQSY